MDEADARLAEYVRGWRWAAVRIGERPVQRRLGEANDIAGADGPWW